MKKFFLSLPLLSFFSAISCVPTTAPRIDALGNIKAVQTSQSLRQAGFKEFLKIKKSKKVSTNRAYNAQVQRVAKRLIPVIDLPGAKWEFVVFDDPTPNAFALPGGKVGVHTGIFQIAKNDAGLAAVLGHEISHVVYNHAGQRQKQQMGISLGGLVLDALLAKNGASKGSRAAVGSVYGLGTAAMYALPHSRNHELESDKVGALFMAKAGYNPREAVKVWERFSEFNKKRKGNSTPSFLRTHPLDSTRIRALQQFMPVALDSYKR